MFGAKSKDRTEVYETLPMVPLRDVVIFPYMMMPFVIGRSSSVRALEYALAHDRRIFLAAQRDATTDDPGAPDIYTVGTVSNVLQSVKLPDGNIKVLVEGADRGRTIECHDDEGFYKVVVKTVPKPQDLPVEADELMSKVVSLFEQYVKLASNLQSEVKNAAVQVDDPGKLSDTIASHLVMTVDEKQNLLEIWNPVERLTRIATALELEVDKLQVDRRVQGRVRKQMERAQKEYYLNEKMKAIQKELGKKDDKGNEVDELKTKIIESKMSKEAEEKAIVELKRLEGDAADVRRGHGVAQLPRLAPRRAVVQKDTREPRYHTRRAHPRRRSLRSRKSERPHHRVPRGTPTRQKTARSDPLPRGPSRRRQKRHSRSRSRARPTASSCGCRWAASVTKPRSAVIAGPISARSPVKSSK